MLFSRSLLVLMVFAAAAFATGPIEFTVGSFTFARPESWEWVTPTSPMRKAQLLVPGHAGSPPAEVTFFHFGAGQGGSVQANVDRWFKQFSDGYTDVKSEQAGSTTITFVKAEGTFASGMPGGPTTPMKNYAMRGAILESSSGDVYVKMTGPTEVVKGAAPALEKMVREAAAH
jgi:hypothetical protein